MKEDYQIPGYFFIYKNKNNQVVIYFYKGLEYNEFDLSDITIPYIIKNIKDGAVEITFLEDVSYIRCKLVKQDGTYEYINQKID